MISMGAVYSISVGGRLWATLKIRVQEPAPIKIGGITARIIRRPQAASYVSVPHTLK
jgi:hypothetical protein